MRVARARVSEHRRKLTFPPALAGIATAMERTHHTLLLAGHTQAHHSFLSRTASQQQPAHPQVGRILSDKLSHLSQLHRNKQSASDCFVPDDLQGSQEGAIVRPVPASLGLYLAMAACMVLTLVPDLRQSTAGLMSSWLTRPLYWTAKSSRESIMESPRRWGCRPRSCSLEHLAL